MSSSDFSQFRNEYSVFSTKVTVDPLNQKIENSFGLKFSDNGKLAFYEKKHEIEDIQLKTLETELDSFILFERNEDPVDIADFLIFFDPFKGINLYNDA